MYSFLEQDIISVKNEMQVQDIDGFFGSWYGPGPALAVADIWLSEPEIEGWFLSLSHCLSLSVLQKQTNKQTNNSFHKEKTIPWFPTKLFLSA